ncbi:MAG: hypothetical protein NC302_05235 [Bacteroidales bacterium]|nr:hypothetical protein [Bacteroidales bacterium]MCM1415151.1 hypothetical protein [bacterium]MCM1423389.1 hypothetical protein [bacterium]
MLNNNAENQEEFEWVKRSFDRYKRELELIDRQNPYECELYSVIAAVIRCCMWEKNISLRDVSRVQTCKAFYTSNFYSDSGFPDFVILGDGYNKQKEADSDHPENNEIYGAVEVKYFFNPLDYHSSGQINAHERYFKKVIYTNGLEWEFRGFSSEIPKKVTLGHFDKTSDKIIWEKEVNVMWEKLLNSLRKIQWKS